KSTIGQLLGDSRSHANHGKPACLGGRPRQEGPSTILHLVEDFLRLGTEGDRPPHQQSPEDARQTYTPPPRSRRAESKACGWNTSGEPKRDYDSGGENLLDQDRAMQLDLR